MHKLYTILWENISKNKSDAINYLYTERNYVAKFMNRGNISSEDVCKIVPLYIHDTLTSGITIGLRIVISDGNHPKDYDAIHIVDKDKNLAVIILHYLYEQGLRGYGTVEFEVHTNI